MWEGVEEAPYVGTHTAVNMHFQYMHTIIGWSGHVTMENYWPKDWSGRWHNILK